MPRSHVLLDTSFVLALENRDDPHHERAKSLDRQLIQEGCTYVLHWGILLEIADGYARIGRRPKGIDLLDRFSREEGYQVHPLTETLITEAVELYQSRPDKEWSLTDCVSFALMNRERMSDALTADAHFRQAGFAALLLDT